MYNKQVNKFILESYGVDLVNDVLFAKDHHVSFCFDWSLKENATLQVLTGDISLLGVDLEKVETIKDLEAYIEIVNPISEVLGVENFISGILDKFDHNGEIPELYLPLKIKNHITWLNISLSALTKKNESNELIYGRINWISDTVPDAIVFYQRTYKDLLTNLFTRETLKEHLKQVRESDHSYGIYFDIDNFKRINDIFGHRLGDDFLRELGNKFISNKEENVTYYRIGGDEFFIYLADFTEKEAYQKALSVIYDVETLNREGRQAEVSASVGIVPIIGADFDFEDLLDLADRTMYCSKSKGKGNISFTRDV